MEEDFPVTVNRLVVIGAACWALSIVVFVDQAIAQAASARPYSLATNLISDLGNTACGPLICSPLFRLVDVTFVVAGLCHTAGAVATWEAWPRRPQRAAGLVLLALAGVCLALAGLAPENVNLALHALGALVGIVSLNVATILLGATVLRAVRGLGAAALAAGGTGLVGTVLFLVPAAGVPPGLAERIADWPAAAMVVVLGAFLLRAAAAPRAVNAS